ncbi:MAG: hypothetical protein NDF55_01850 [archaeon GB-1867-005]|nr:hypothetical protein [Candidatus Culexmicrobium cathedralense]
MSKSYAIPDRVLFLMVWVLINFFINVIFTGPFAILFLPLGLPVLFLGFQIANGSLRSLWAAYILTVLASIITILCIVNAVFHLVNDLYLAIPLMWSAFIPTLLPAFYGRRYAEVYGLQSRIPLSIMISIITANIIIYLIIKILLKNEEVKKYFKIKAQFN